MYKPVKTSGDIVEVPQLLFSRLGIVGDDSRFRVALYIISSGGAEARTVAKALSVPLPKVEAALSYWEGAGLIERKTAYSEDSPVPQVKPSVRRRMTTRESMKAGNADPTLGVLVSELQRLFGAVVSESDINIYLTLCVHDGFAADLILMAASEALAHGARSARYVEKVLFGWRDAGIHDCTAADAHLKQMALRGEREQVLAKAWGLKEDPFTLAEKRKIAMWYEEYGFGDDMIEAARLAAGDKCNEVKYLAGILKKWYTNGWHTPRDVQQAEGGANLRVTRGGALKDDVLAGAANYVPLKQRRGE